MLPRFFNVHLPCRTPSPLTSKNAKSMADLTDLSGVLGPNLMVEIFGFSREMHGTNQGMLCITLKGLLNISCSLAMDVLQDGNRHQ